MPSRSEVARQSICSKPAAHCALDRAAATRRAARARHRASPATCGTRCAGAPLPVGAGRSRRRRRGGARGSRRCHAGDELGARSSSTIVVGDAQRAQAVAGERDLQRGARAAARASSALRHRRRREPARAPRRGSRDAQQQERRLRQVLVAEAHQALDVVELDRRIGAGARFASVIAASARRAPAHRSSSPAPGLRGCAGCARGRPAVRPGRPCTRPASAAGGGAGSA